MSKKYVKKPVIVEAVQYTGDNVEEILQFVSAGTRETEKTENGIIIHTLEGDMLASVGDYIIRGVHGEHYPCKPDIFVQTYSEV